MIVAISAGLSDGSATTRLAGALAEEAAAHLGSTAEVIELRPYARDIAEAMVTGWPSERLNEVFAKISRAEAIVAAAPVYNALPSGLFVEFFDVLPEGLLEGKPVAIGATGGSPRHSLVTEQAIRPMFVYLHADVPTTAVYAATEDWGAPGVGFDGGEGRSLYTRIARSGRQLAALVRGAASSDAATRESRHAGAGERAAVEPRQELAEAEAEFPDFVPFDRLLAGS
ncbi:MAG: NAD(P)H-dependent oxidoreductase [Actinomycetaceae bacterium]|nr:NAD(P)H-dependent oxidoreductase [Actinomycetaceae bacterium]